MVLASDESVRILLSSYLSHIIQNHIKLNIAMESFQGKIDTFFKERRQ